MVHLPEPGPDVGFFSTSEVHRQNANEQKISRTIALRQGKFSSPPRIGVGLNAVDTGAVKGDNIRIHTSVSRVFTDSFDVGFRTWWNSTLNSGKAVWTEAKEGAKDTQLGEWATMGPSTKQQSGHIQFEKPFAEPPEIVLWFNYLDLKSKGEQYRLHTFASDVTKEGFTVNVDTWNMSEFYKVGVTWIASKKNRRGIETGRFVDSTKAIGKRAQKTRKVEFPKGKFSRPPTVLSGLSMIDNSAESPLRLASVVNDVSADGFTWTMETDTKWQTSADFIAIG